MTIFVFIWLIAGATTVRQSERSLDSNFIAESPDREKIEEGRENYILYDIKPTSESGRYNQTETDYLDKLYPKCSSECLEVLPINSSSEFCYCLMGCPLPISSFTQEVLIPKDLSCFTDTSMIKDPLRMKGNRQTKAFLPWFCNRIEELLSSTSMLFAFLCVHDTNLGYSKFFYDINPGLALLSPEGELVARSRVYHRKQSKYNWRVESTRWLSAQHLITKKNFTLLKIVNTDVYEATAKFYSIDGINFTRSENLSDGCTSFSVLNPIEFSIKAPIPCSQQPEEERTLEECIYLMRGKAFEENCTLAREALEITARIMAHTMFPKKKLLGGLMEAEERDGSCGSIAGHGRITLVSYREHTIGIYVSLSSLSSDEHDSVEFPLRLLYNRFSILQQEYANLPRFWSEILFSKCPEQFCWRDLAEIGPKEGWRMSEPDDILWRNFIHCCLPILPFCFYFFLPAIM